MKFIDVKNKKLRWYNRNLFYFGTILVVFINIFAFFYNDNKWQIKYVYSNWDDVFNFENLIVSFVSAFKHSNMQHCLLNSLCFLIAGSYVERKIGSVNLFILVFVFALFGEAMVDANYRGISVGFSGVNFALYAFILIDFAFMFIFKKQTLVCVIYGLIVIGLIYLACCFNGGTKGVSFATYPYDLITNMGHYTAFITGAVLTLLINFVKLYTIKNNN